MFSGNSFEYRKPCLYRLILMLDERKPFSHFSMSRPGGGGSLLSSGSSVSVGSNSTTSHGHHSHSVSSLTNNHGHGALSLIPSSAAAAAAAAAHLSLQATAQHMFQSAAASGGHGSLLEGSHHSSFSPAVVTNPLFVHPSTSLLQILMAAERCQVRLCRLSS
jgi:hypothetical protein